MCDAFWGPNNEILHFDPILLKNVSVRSIFDGTISAQNGFNMGTSSVNIPKTTSLRLWKLDDDE